MGSYTPLCARCKEPLEVVADSDPEAVACPTCGEGDTVENVTREVGEYITEKMFSDMLRDAAEKSSALTFTEGPKRAYRFITKDESQ
jgi:hypothetical protein